MLFKGYIRLKDTNMKDILMVHIGETLNFVFFENIKYNFKKNIIGILFLFRNV